MTKLSGVRSPFTPHPGFAEKLITDDRRRSGPGSTSTFAILHGEAHSLEGM